MIKEYLQTKYKEGAYSGQCVSSLHKFFLFPYGVDPKGNDVNLKFALVKSNGDCYPVGNIAEIAKGYRIGDCIFTTEGATKHWYGWTGAGHMACIIGFDRDNLVLAESNFKLDGKFRYGRKLSMTSPKIIGIGRFPFLDLKLKPVLNLNVFINKMIWKTAVFQQTSDLIKKFSSDNLEVNFVPVMKTNLSDWWYEDFPFNGSNYKVIAKAFLEDKVRPLTYPNINGYILAINHAEWGGTVTGAIQGEELAWTSFERPAVIQMRCEEKDISPYYNDISLFTHAVTHELGHYLNYVAGSKSDSTDFLDSQRQLSYVYSNIDWNRVALNL